MPNQVANCSGVKPKDINNASIEVRTQIKVIDLLANAKLPNSRQELFATLNLNASNAKTAIIKALLLIYPHLVIFCLALVPSSFFASQHIHVL